MPERDAKGLVRPRLRKPTEWNTCAFWVAGWCLATTGNWQDYHSKP